MHPLILAAGYLLLLGALAYPILKAWDLWTMWRHRVSPEDAERRRLEYLNRLRRPQWDELEAHFRAAAPPDIRALYASDVIEETRLKLSRPLPDDPENHEWVDHFTPADLAAVEEASWVVSGGRFPFAADGMGNYYTTEFRPGSPVLFHMHDGGESWELAPSLREFLKLASVSGQAAGQRDEADEAGDG